jgi:uncharacterized protein GlcG (DUF336 family)
MTRPMIDRLEDRRLLAATLDSGDVKRILGQAASQTLAASLDKMVVAVVDREANVLGIFGRSGAIDGTDETNAIVLNAIARARTAALFQSRDDAFSTRSARFIIQDHFPTPIKGTPGGPLYGVQFSNLLGSDIVANAPGISGDPGGVPLFKDGEPVGAIGVAGDFHDTAAREDLLDLTPDYDANPDRRVFAGKEESDLDEAVALAGAQGYMAAKEIGANLISIDGLALPFIVDKPRAVAKTQPLKNITRAGLGSTRAAPPFKATADLLSTPSVPFPTATFAGNTGQLKRQDLSVPLEDRDYGIVSSNDREEFITSDTLERLTTKDVTRIIERAVTKASTTRAGIRLPIDKPVSVHIAVVDRNGDLLGVFRMNDGTNFSYDVAVQKARTAAFFSDETHAFSTRAIGFMSQQFFPIGIEGDKGPLYQLQNGLSSLFEHDVLRQKLTLPSGTRSGEKNPLRNGITVFAGGVPLYKNGQLVGAIGVSGDGIDQDDLTAFSGAGNMNAPLAIRADTLARSEIRSHIADRAGRLFDLFGRKRNGKLQIGDVTLPGVVRQLEKLAFRLPYVKFPRNPEL